MNARPSAVEAWEAADRRQDLHVMKAQLADDVRLISPLTDQFTFNGPDVMFAAMHAGADITYGQWALWMLWVIPANMLGGVLIMTLPRLIRSGELLLSIRRGELSIEDDEDIDEHNP